MYGANDITVDKATVVAFFQEYRAVDEHVAEAIGMRKELRRRIKGAKINLPAFDLARKQADKSGERRELEEREYRYYMECIDVPVPDWSAASAAAGITTNGEDTDGAAEISEHQVRRATDHGFIIGKDGKARNSNPWNPGSYLAKIWDEAWERGAEDLALSQPPADTTPKRRGRPPGSRNKRSSAPPPVS